MFWAGVRSRPSCAAMLRQPWPAARLEHCVRLLAGSPTSSLLQPPALPLASLTLFVLSTHLLCSLGKQLKEYEAEKAAKAPTALSAAASTTAASTSAALNGSTPTPSAATESPPLPSEPAVVINPTAA